MKRFRFSAHLMPLVVALLAVLSAWGGVEWSEYLAKQEAATQKLAQQQRLQHRRSSGMRWRRTPRPQWRLPTATPQADVSPSRP